MTKIQNLQGRAPSRPIIICGHNRAWPSILHYEYMNISYMDYPIKSGNDIKRDRWKFPSVILRLDRRIQ